MFTYISFLPNGNLNLQTGQKQNKWIANAQQIVILHFKKYS
jgi:hypothetical protein